MENNRRIKISVDVDEIIGGEKQDYELNMKDLIFVEKTHLGSFNRFVNDIMPAVGFITTVITLIAVLGIKK